MADLYYIDSGYLTPDAGYYTYIADGAAAPSSQFTISCDATRIGAVTEAAAALSTAVTLSAIATVGKETSVALTSTATVSTTATRIQEASATFTSAFAPTLTVEVFKNSFAVLDCPTVLTSIPTVNRSITQVLDNIATLNAMAAKIAEFNSSFTSMATISATATSVKISSASLTSTVTLSATVTNVKSTTVLLPSASTLTVSARKLARRTIVTGPETSTPSPFAPLYINTSSKKFGAAAALYDGSTTISPITLQKPIWNGSTFKIFTTGYTWTSSNGLDWTRTTNNIGTLGASVSEQIRWTGSHYISWKANPDSALYDIWYSYDGDTWSQLINLGSTRTVQNAVGVTRGSYLYLIYCYTDTNASILVTRYPINGDNTLGTGTTVQTLSSLSNGKLINGGIDDAGNVAFLYRSGTGSTISTILSSGSGSLQTTWNSNTIISASSVYGIDYVYGNSHAMIASDGKIYYGATRTSSWTYVVTISNATEIAYENSTWIVACSTGNLKYNSALNTAFSDSGLDYRTTPEYGSGKYLIWGSTVVTGNIEGAQAQFYYTTKYSTNLTSWTEDSIDSVEYLRNGVVYTQGASPLWNSFKSVDLWFKPNSTTLTYFNLFGEDVYSDTCITFNNGNIIVYQLTNVQINAASSAYTVNTWNHLRFVYNGTNASLYINGTRVGTSASWTAGPYAISNIKLWDAAFTSSNEINDLELDEYYVTSTLLNDPSATSITVPTTAWQNDANTALLLHFNSDFADDAIAISIASVSLSSTTTLSANITGTKKVSAGLSSSAVLTLEISKITVIASTALTSTASLTCATSKLVSSTVVLASTATATATATRIKQLTSAQSSEFAVDCSGKVKRNIIDIHLPAVTATLDIDYTRIRNLDSAFASAFSPTLIATAQLAGVALLESTTNLSAVSSKTTGITAGLTSTATVNANVGRLISAAADISSLSTVTADITHLVGVSITANSQFTTVCDVSRIRTVSTSLSSAVTLSAAVSRTRNVDGTLSTAFTESATVLRIQSGSVTASSTVSVSANVVKTARGVVTASSQFTEIANAVKTARATTEFSAIATELTAAVKNATGTITMESHASLTASIGRIIQLDANRNFGVRSSQYYFPRLRTNDIPYGGWGPLDRGFTAAIWTRRYTTNTYSCIWSAMYQWPTTPTFATWGLIIDNNDVRLRSYFDADEPGATWANLAPTDTNWHQYVLQYQGSNSWKLWIDGVSKGVQTYGAAGINEWEKNRPTYGENSWITIGGNLTLNQTGVYDEAATQDTNMDFAQVWIGAVDTYLPPGQSGLESQYRISPTFNITDFYDGGYVDLGGSGRGEFNQLPVPYIYNTLSSPYTTVEYYGTPPATSGAGVALTTPTTEINTSLSAQPIVALVFSASLNSTSTLSVTGNYRISSASALSSTSTLTATAIGYTGISSNQSVTATLAATAYRIKQFAATVSTISTVSILGGKLKLGSGNFSATATVVCEYQSIPAIQGSAALASAFTVTAQVNERQGFTITPSSQFTIACDFTVIPPIRTSANLISTASLTATPTKVVKGIALEVSAVTLVCAPVKTARAVSVESSTATLSASPKYYIGIVAHLQSQGFVLTAGDVVNLDPYRTWIIEAESRDYYILAESREYIIEQEYREYTIEGIIT